MQKGSVPPLNKRIFCLMLALIVAALGFGALAEAIPSATVETIMSVSSVVSSTGAALPESFSVELAPQSEAAEKVIEEIAEAVQTQPVTAYFGETAMAAIAEKLPAEVNVSALKLHELTAVKVEAYDSSYGDIVLTLTPSIEYAENAVIVVLVGMWIDGELVWTPMDAVIIDGQISVVFTQDVLADGNSELLFALLSTESV